MNYESRMQRYQAANQVLRDTFWDTVKINKGKVAGLAVVLGLSQLPQFSQFDGDKSDDGSVIPCVTSLGTPIAPKHSFGPDTCVHAYDVGETRMSSIIYEGTNYCIAVNPQVPGADVIRVGEYCVGYNTPTPEVNE